MLYSQSILTLKVIEVFQERWIRPIRIVSPKFEKYLKIDLDSFRNISIRLLKYMPRELCFFFHFYHGLEIIISLCNNCLFIYFFYFIIYALFCSLILDNPYRVTLMFKFRYRTVFHLYLSVVSYRYLNNNNSRLVVRFT